MRFWPIFTTIYTPKDCDFILGRVRWKQNRVFMVKTFTRAKNREMYPGAKSLRRILEEILPLQKYDV